MKKSILFLLLLSSFFVKAQSLKDALYGGKLKNDPGTVIRRGDDLSTKIDTSSNKVSDSSLRSKYLAVSADSTLKAANNNLNQNTAARLNESNSAAANSTSTSATVTTTDTSAAVINSPVPIIAPPVATNNNMIWKEHIDSLRAAWKKDILDSRKVKSGTYYVTLSYSIGIDGQVDVTDVFVSPDNSFLQQQLKERLNMDTPHLIPATTSTGAPRKVSKKYNFMLTK